MNKRLVEERVNAGMEISEVARKAGIPDHVVRRAESGTRPRPANAAAIAGVFGLKATDLFPVEAPR